MASITKRYANNSKHSLKGWQLRAPRIGVSSVFFPASIYRLDEVQRMTRIMDEIETAHTRGKRPNSDVYDELKTINDDRLFQALANAGIIELAKVMTLGELVESAVDAFRKLGDKPRTIKGLKNSAKQALEYFGKDCPIQEIDKKSAIAFGQWLQEKNTYKQTTLFSITRRVKQVFNWAVRNDIVAVNPFDSLRIGTQTTAKENTVLTEAEAARMLEIFGKTDYPEFHQAYFLMGYCQGLRLQSEAPYLLWEGVDYSCSPAFIQIRDIKRGKQGNIVVREMPLRPETIDALQRLRAAQKRRGIQSRFIFPELWKIQGIELSTAQRYRFTNILKKEGIEIPSPFNTLRRTASNFWRNLVGVYWENVFLGHTETVAKTAYYNESLIPSNVLKAIQDIKPTLSVMTA